MKDRSAFRAEIRKRLSDLDPAILAFDENEFWMIRSPYEFLEYYALEHQYINTCIALPLARGLHNGTHRKSRISKDGCDYRLPYVIHCLLVARILAHLHIPLSDDEKDILLAAALCHDMIEDIPFPDHGTELITQYHLDPRVYETVKLVSKRKDFTKQQEQEFFRNIAQNKLAMLVKLSDRSHNVEDLYNMSVWKVHEYISETKEYFLPMCQYGLEHFPELGRSIEILQDKILCLTNASEILVDRCEAREQQLLQQLKLLQEENSRLRQQYGLLMGGAING